VFIAECNGEGVVYGEAVVFGKKGGAINADGSLAGPGNLLQQELTLGLLNSNHFLFSAEIQAFPTFLIKKAAQGKRSLARFAM